MPPTLSKIQNSSRNSFQEKCFSCLTVLNINLSCFHPLKINYEIRKAGKWKHNTSFDITTNFNLFLSKFPEG